MNDHELKRAFDTMTENVRPNRVEDRVKKRIYEKTDRRRVRIPRAAVVACLLALTAVSAGAYKIYRDFTIFPQADVHEPYTVMIHAGEDSLKFPLLSEEKIEQIGELCRQGEEESNDDFYERRLKFSSWKEAEEWLGCDLLTSDLLGKPQQNTIWGADILVNPVYFDEELYYIDLFSTHLLENEEEHMLCYMELTIPASETFLEWIRDGIFGKTGNLYSGVPEGEPEIMTYSAENGLDAEIAGMYKRYDGSHIYDPVVYQVNSYVMHEGVIYDFDIWDKDRELTLEAMYAVLDSLR